MKKKEKISLSARLMALADVYDALVSKRCYKDAISHEESVDFIINASGHILTLILSILYWT